jgi:hypothetical protein
MRPINRAEVAAERDSAAGPPLPARLTPACEQGTTPLARNGRRLSVASAEGEFVSELSKSSLCIPARTCKGGGVHGATSTSDEGVLFLLLRHQQSNSSVAPCLPYWRREIFSSERRGSSPGDGLQSLGTGLRGNPLIIRYARSAARLKGERRWARFVHAWADDRKLVNQSVFSYVTIGKPGNQTQVALERFLTFRPKCYESRTTHPGQQR